MTHGIELPGAAIVEARRMAAIDRGTLCRVMIAQSAASLLPTCGVFSQKS